MKCRECPDYEKCWKEGNLTIKRKSCQRAKTKHVKTNADRIRSMHEEELAKIIRCPYEIDEEPCVNPGSCLDCCLDWLQQPAEEETQ